MIVIGSDHAGVDLKNNIVGYFDENGIKYIDINKILVNNSEDDYPDIAYNICNEVLKDEENIGIAICGTGIGISIACNKVNGIRAANCFSIDMAKMAKKHNNANVLCLGARLSLQNDVIDIIKTFLNSKFESGRHMRRIDKIHLIEKCNRGETSYGDCL